MHEMEIRELGPGDHEQSWRLGAEAFGAPADATPSPVPSTPPAAEGRHPVGAFERGRLVAKVSAHELGSWWGGVGLPTCGIAGVVVAPEHRGSGLLRPLLERAIGDARARGDLVSTLFPTAAGIYRSLGYEMVSSFDQVEVPTADLTRLTPSPQITLRRAAAADIPALRAVYGRWASAQNGPLTRLGPRFASSADDLVAAPKAITLAERDGQIVGYVEWQRSESYGADGVLDVAELIAVDGGAYRSLWWAVGSFAPVAPTARIWTSGMDPARAVLPTSAWQPRQRYPYSLRVLDVAGAVTALRPGLPGLHRGIPFDVADQGFRLVLGTDAGVCESGPTGDGPAFSPQGFSLLFAGAQTCGNLRLLGHLTGPAQHDAVLDGVLGTRPVHIRNYF